MRAHEPIEALNKKHVSSDDGNIFQEGSIQTGDSGSHQRDGDDSDDDAEGGENRAELVSANGGPGDTQTFLQLREEVHTSPCGGQLGMHPGDVTFQRWFVTGD